MVHYLLSIGIFFAAQQLTPAEKSMQKYERASWQSMKSSISEVLEDGGVIVLENGTRWAVDPDDMEATAGWLGPAPIEIKKGPHPNAPFPKLMLNKWTKKVVSVRQIG